MVAQVDTEFLSLNLVPVPDVCFPAFQVTIWSFHFVTFAAASIVIQTIQTIRCVT